MPLPDPDQVELVAQPVQLGVLKLAQSQAHPKQISLTPNPKPWQAQARVQLAGVDLLLVPTAVHHYTVAEIEAQEQAPQVCCVPAAIFPAEVVPAQLQ